jgi:DNA-binding transcriptional LysR family regulator
MIPDWENLRVFLEVARAGTLAAAGRKLELDNTTVGRRLAKLERELAAKLFARTPDGMLLTVAGEAMRAAAEEMEQAVLRGEQRALGADKSLAGLVRIATTEMIAQAVVLPAVQKLRDRHPQIRVELLTGAGRLDLSRREADLALRYVRPEAGELLVRKAGAVAYGAYAAKRYLAERGWPKLGDGFAGHDLLTYDPTIRSWGSGLAGQPISDARVVLRSNSTLSMLRAVQLGLGIGAVPCFLARADKSLARVPAGAPPEVDPLWLVLHPDVARTGRVRAVLDAVEARLAELAEPLATVE